MESRIPLAADLEAFDAYLVDINANPIEGVVEGERVLVRVNYRMTDLTTDDKFRIRFELGDEYVDSNEYSGVPGTGLEWYRYYYVGYATAGTHLVKVTVDYADQVQEANENNNSQSFEFTTLEPDHPQKFVTPVAGEASVDWTLVNYHDVILREGARQDFLGGMHQYDGHTGWDFFVPHFSVMDQQGIPIFAAADGVVIATEDGNFDREDFWDFTLPDPRRTNFVRIDHGNGWETLYGHIQRDTVSVQPGDIVRAGQTIGLAGSSGISTGAHLHFTIYRNGIVVEPLLAPEKYFHEPVIYTGDYEPGVVASGITTLPLTTLEELPNETRNIEFQSGDQVRLWYRLDYYEANDVLRNVWYRPDGTVYLDGSWDHPEDVRYLRFWTTSFGFDRLGEWTVRSYHNDRLILEETYNVSVVPSEPEIDVHLGETYIVDARSTPIDFGEAAAEDPAPEFEFTINNVGTGPLRLSDLQLPPGFELVGSFPGSIPRDSSSSVTIRMPTINVGRHWGDVSFTTNDVDETTFSFAVEGIVTGQGNQSAPIITGPEHAKVIQGISAREAIFSSLVIFDEAADFQGGSIRVRIVSGEEVGTDTLRFKSDFTGMRLRGNTVFLDNDPIAELSPWPQSNDIELQITADVSLLTVGALAESIVFWQQTESPSSRRRIVALDIADGAGNKSQTYYRGLYYSPDGFQHPPEVFIDDYVGNEDETIRLPILVSDLDSPTGELTLTAFSSDQQIVPDASLSFVHEDDQLYLVANPLPNSFGELAVDITVADPDGNSTTIGSYFVIESVNDLPSVTEIADQSVEVDEQIGPLSFTISDPETAAAELIVTASSDNEAVISSEGISLGGDSAQRTILLTPQTEQAGTALITILVRDADGASTETTFQVDVGVDRESPVVDQVPGQEAEEDSELIVRFTASDDKTPADELELLVTTENETLFPAGSLSITSLDTERTLSIQPAPNRFGTGRITVSAIDLWGNRTDRSFLVTILPVNDSPLFVVETEVSADEDAARQTLAVSSISPGMHENQFLEFSVGSDNEALFEVLDIVYQPGSTDGSLHWKPVADAYGSSEVTLTISDGGNDNDLATLDDNLTFSQLIQISVNSVNDPPFFLSEEQATVEEDAGPQSLDVSLVNAGADEMQAIAFDVSSDVPELFETLRLDYESGSPDGALVWEPAANTAGLAVVTLTLTDAGNDDDLDTEEDNLTFSRGISITVEEVNDPPSFSVQKEASVDEDAALQLLPVTLITPGANETQPLSFSLETNNAALLEVLEMQYESGQTAATLNWKPASNAFGTADVILTIIDGGIDQDLATEDDNLSFSETIAFQVNEINDAPTRFSIASATFREDSVSADLGEAVIEDVDDEEHDFSFSDPRFEIRDGRLWTKTDAAFDYETEAIVDLQVTATDPGGESITEEVQLFVSDVNEPAEALQIGEYVLYTEVFSQTLAPITVVDPESEQSHEIVSLDSRFVVEDGLLQLASSQSISANSPSIIDVSFRVTDNGSPPHTTELSIPLNVTLIESPWQNPSNAIDVSADGFVTPIDALLVINYLNQGGPSQLTPEILLPTLGGPFLDVTGDRNVSPLDALVVINFLNTGEGEGERIHRQSIDIALESLDWDEYRKRRFDSLRLLTAE